MKKVWRIMLLFVAFLIIAFLGLTVAIRLAPVDAAAWHVDPAAAFPADAPRDAVRPLTGGAVMWLSPERGDAQDLLARLDEVALATARTRRIAGSVTEGRITWESRSLIWGFPDYTTAEARPDGLVVFARLRFGESDLGVNARRLTDWLARL